MTVSKEWFSAQELVAVSGLPGTARGVRKKAESEDWPKQKKAKGKGFEYHLSSLPPEAQAHLGGKKGKEGGRIKRMTITTVIEWELDDE